jgi:acyl dehydratase
MPTIFQHPSELAPAVGKHLGYSEWLEITQDRVNRFADATGDHQWIHVDPVRAAAELPGKTTIAHGFLTLSLVSTMFRDAIRLTNLRMALNYGVNRVRFVSPVPAGSRIRSRLTLKGVETVSGGLQANWQATVEREGGDKPACVADWIVRYYPESGAPNPQP